MTGAGASNRNFGHVFRFVHADSCPRRLEGVLDSIHLGGQSRKRLVLPPVTDTAGFVAMRVEAYRVSVHRCMPSGLRVLQS